MKVVLECIHDVNLREPCADCEADQMQPHLRIIVDGILMQQVDRLQENQPAVRGLDGHGPGYD